MALRHHLKPRLCLLILALTTALSIASPLAARPVQVMVELTDPAAAVVYAQELAARGEAAARTAARGQVARVAAAQEGVVRALVAPQLGGRVVFRVQRVLNGVAVVVDSEKVAAVRRLPGVARVVPMVPKWPANSTSVPFIGTPEVWDGGGMMGTGWTGAGVSIGVIDTGVDYLHTDFGGSGVAADYAANDGTVVGDGFFPSVKVVGGFDFVGDAYDAASEDPMAATPQPDPDPMDCNGHGTHVAGTAAGYGVASDGSTYLGGYGQSTPFGSLRIGPGVAPQATIYALRVFGCDGATAVVEQALEWAVDPNGDGDFGDHLDVVNLSLTSPFGTADDPTALAADNAALAGVVVVASAGNDGDSHFVNGSPGVAGRVVEAAASWDPDSTFPTRGVRVTAPPSIAGAHQAGGANFGPPLTAPGVSGEAALAAPADACTPLANAPEVTGKVAVVDRSPSCTYPTQVRHAQDAGAIAVVIVNDRPGLEGVFNDGTGGDVTIPPLMVRQAAGEGIKAQLPGTVELTLTPILLADVGASFSSRGPRQGAPELALKPDVAAPGVVITSARLGNAASGGTAAMILSGTSMAAPHVAGAAALLREQHPGWTPEEVKAALMNTAGDVFLDPELTPPVMGPARMGAGRIRPASAARVGVIVRDSAAPERVGVSFGRLEVTEDTTVERVVRIDNGSAAAVTYALALRTTSDVPGVETALPDGETVSVPAGGVAELRLRLAVVAELLRHSHDPALDATLGFPRSWLSEEAGYLTLTPVAGAESETLRLPFYAAVRPASEMAAAQDRLDLGAGLTGTASLPLAGRGVATGEDLPYDVESLVSAFELQAGADAASTDDPFAIAHVGVASDLRASPGGFADARIFFAVVTRGDVSTPHGARVEVFIDVDRDGASDFVLRSSDRVSFALDFPSDAFYTVLEDLATHTETLQLPLGFLTPDVLDTVPFLTDARILGVAAADLGLAPGASAFDYFVAVTGLTAGGTIAAATASGALGAADQSPLLTWDPAAPGLDFAGGVDGLPLYSDQGGESLPVAYDLPAFDAHGSLGALLVHHHAAAGARAEVVALAAHLPDLAVTQSATPDPVGPGGTLRYTIRVRNEGPVAAAAVTVDDTLPPEVAFEPAGSDPGCALVEGVVRCPLGDLAAGSVRTVVISATVDPGVASGAVVVNTARAATATIDPNPLNDAAQLATVVSHVLPRATMQHTGETSEGGTVRYLIELSNDGVADQGDNPGPELLDVLPPELALMGASASAGTVTIDRAAGTVAWSGPLAAGAPAVSLQIDAVVRAGTTGARVVNQASLFYDADADGANDATSRSDDPTLPGGADPTVFIAGALFADGFESGGLAAWSNAVP